jgi:hypothetical protein
LSEHVHTTLQEAQDIREMTYRGDRLAPVATAVFAVLAALGTLFSHHRSILVLTAKNEAILTQARASDRYNSYESKRIRYHVFQALLAAGLPPDPAERTRLTETADKLDKASLETLAEASGLEQQSNQREGEAATLLKSYETLEVGTTFCEISIVIASISALAYRTRVFLAIGAALCATGVVFLAFGYFQGH